MNNFFKNASFDFTCPKCRSNIQVNVSSVGSSVNCPYCRQTITFKG